MIINPVGVTVYHSPNFTPSNLQLSEAVVSGDGFSLVVSLAVAIEKIEGVTGSEVVLFRGVKTQPAQVVLV
jgi:hypothetical protein